AMMAMTTSNSISVKAQTRRGLRRSTTCEDERMIIRIAPILCDAGAERSLVRCETAPLASGTSIPMSQETLLGRNPDYGPVGRLPKNDVAIHKALVPLDAMKDSLKLHPVVPSVDGCCDNSIHTEAQGRMYSSSHEKPPKANRYPPQRKQLPTSP